MRVLISAFGFSPYRGSECAVGWNLATELAKYHDVTVLTGDVRTYENEYARYEKENGAIPGLTVVYVKPSWEIRLFEKLHTIPGCWMLYYCAYRRWQVLAYEHARRLHHGRPFDLVHHLNMIGYREPGYLWKLGIPFVWGPVGGSPNEPLAYWRMFSAKGLIRVVSRYVMNELQKHLAFRAKRAAYVARKIWAVTSADYHTIHDLWGQDCEMMVETGTVLRPEGHVRKWDGREQLRIIWSGLHEGRKALPILLHALAHVRQELPDRHFFVDVLGSGVETANWKRLGAKLGLSSFFCWHGRLEHDKALEIMNKGHIFAFPSLKEGTPHVVLEALSLGLPVICHNACGMGTVVNERCGVKIPLITPGVSIKGFAEAIMAILLQKKDLHVLSEGALERAKELSWEAKARQISAAYGEICPGR